MLILSKVILISIFMYFAISILLTIFTLYELVTLKPSKIISHIIWLVLTFLLCFRYGQGTDYFNYLAQFESVDPDGSLFHNTLYHGEPGWYALLLLAKRSGMSFELFVGIISFVMMLLIRRGITKFSPYKAMSYLLLFPTYYMTYCNAAIRQALVLAIFFGFGLQYLVEGKRLKYFVLIIVISFIHSSALALLVPLLVHLSDNKKSYLVWLPLTIIIVVFYSYSISESFFSQYSFSLYLNNNYSIVGILLRIILACVVWILYNNRIVYRRNDDKIITVFFNLYMIGFIVFMVFSFTGTFAQRLTMPFKALEVLAIPMMISYNKRLKNKSLTTGIVFCLCLIMNVELLKNIDSYINQGEYRSDVTVLNYPYVSVFDESAIYQYRGRLINGDN